MMPRYTIDPPESIEVQLLGGKRLVFRKQEIKIEPAPRLTFSNCIRTFGSAGFMGYTGWYYGAGLGRFRMYARSMESLCVITDTDGRKTVINYRLTDPDQPDKQPG